MNPKSRVRFPPGVLSEDVRVVKETVLRTVGESLVGSIPTPRMVPVP